MTQSDINQSEWSNEENWSGPKWLKLYFGRRDGRVWVPKRRPSFGWTINLGNPKGAVWLFGVVVGAIALVVLSNILMFNFILKR